MTIRSILAAYSGDAAGCSGLDLALFMQRKYGAHLTGVVWHGPGLIETRFRAYMTRDILDVLHERDAAQVAAMRSDFEARVSARGDPTKAHFLDLAGETDFSLAESARGFDIVVMTRLAADASRAHFTARPDVVALRSGRPVIVVPPDYAATELGEHALIAWDGKRASARALGDAMHILETKTRVTLLSVGAEAPGEVPGTEVMTLLERHGIAATRLVRPAGRGGAAATILDACAEFDAGLLVMGAYEHSKFAEDLLGGVTRDILARAPLPVLMSH
jgi:nucleotide-binding universal stress UspA family protein